MNGETMAMIENIIYEKLKKPYSEQIDIPTLGKTAEEHNQDNPKVWLTDLNRYIYSMENTRQNYAFRHIYSCRKIIGGAIVFFKRVIRKLLKWYIEPICNQQTEFNNAVTPAIGRLTQFSHLTYQMAEQTKGAQESIRQDVVQISHLLDQRAEQTENVQESIRQDILQISHLLDQRAEQTESAQENIRQDILRISHLLDQRAEQTENAQESIRQDIFQISHLLNQRVEQTDSTQKKIKQDILHICEEHEKTKGFQEKENTFLRERVDALYAAIDEMKAMLAMNATDLHVVKADLDKVREIDASLFDETNRSFFDKRTTSQSGEDSIIAYILMVMGYHLDEISYLDLGANHAQELSNTFYFYQKGARGVLVEANPHLIPELKLQRNKDTVLNRCVADSDGELIDFYILNGDGLSSRSRSSVDNAVSINTNLQITQTVQVKTISVKRILEDYFTQAPTILNVDIEGSEMDVLTSWDFSKYRPVVIVAETIPYEPNLVVGKKDMEIIGYLQNKGYVEYAFTGINSIFIDKERVKGGPQV